MLLMACRARPILNDVRFMKAVLLVAALAFAIDRFDGDAVVKTIADHFGKLSANGGIIVTFLAIVRELGVGGCDLAGVKKSFLTAARENKNCEQPAEDRDQADNQSCEPPRMKAPVVAEIAFVALGDLLLRARRSRHRFSN